MSETPTVKAKVEAVEIRAEVRQIKTMADGSVNVTLNLPEYCMEQVKAMMDWLKLEVVAVIAQVSVGEKEKEQGKYGL